MQNKLHNNLRKIRELRKIKVEQLALNVGVTANYISLIERGHYAPRLKLALKIAKELNITVDEIFGQDFEKGNK